MNEKEYIYISRIKAKIRLTFGNIVASFMHLDVKQRKYQTRVCCSIEIINHDYRRMSKKQVISPLVIRSVCFNELQLGRA